MNAIDKGKKELEETRLQLATVAHDLVEHDDFERLQASAGLDLAELMGELLDACRRHRAAVDAYENILHEESSKNLARRAGLKSI